MNTSTKFTPNCGDGELGMDIWAKVHQGSWMKGTFISEDCGIAKVIINSEVLEFDLIVDSTVIQLSNDATEPNMASLRYIHEPGILFNIDQRFIQQCYYTYMGSVLVSLNPLQNILKPNASDFIDKPFNSDYPHPYGIAGKSL